MCHDVYNRNKVKLNVTVSCELSQLSMCFAITTKSSAKGEVGYAAEGGSSLLRLGNETMVMIGV